MSTEAGYIIEGFGIGVVVWWSAYAFNLLCKIIKAACTDSTTTENS